jgi:membrane protease YdiL (CAAX protease family)
MRGTSDGWRWGDMVTLLGLLVYALRPSLPAPILGAAGAALLTICVRPLPGDGRFSRPARATLGALCLYPLVPGVWRIWPAYLLVPIAAALLLGFAAGFGRDFLAALQRGQLGRSEWRLIALIAFVAAVALIGWAVLLQPDLTRLRAMVPHWPLLWLIGAGAAFSIVNAIMEEIVWRGILQRWLMTLMAPFVAVAVQAASFGAGHYHGFPSGSVGIVLAAIWGGMIGALAVRSRGLLAPIVAHVAADAVIFGVLAGALG